MLKFACFALLMPVFLLAEASAAQQAKAPHVDEEHSVGLDELGRLVGSGIIKPLSEVVLSAQSHFPGELIDADLEFRNNHYVYELEILRDSQRLEIYVDARTLSIVGKD